MIHFRRLSSPPDRSARAGFTLVEMLTVVGIITLLIALTAPTLVDVIRSTRLNSAGDSLVNRISLAQQSAIGLSAEVEVRFYKYIDANSDRPDALSFYAYQVVHDRGNNLPPLALSEPYFLESGIIFSDNGQLSPLLQETRQQTEADTNRYLFNPAVANVNPDQVQYAALRFYPDGSCRSFMGTGTGENKGPGAFIIPELQTSFLTLIESRFGSDVSAPKNFYCVQIDSYTGKTRVYRP